MLNDFGDRIDCRQRVIWSDWRAYNGLTWLFFSHPFHVCATAIRNQSIEIKWNYRYLYRSKLIIIINYFYEWRANFISSFFISVVDCMDVCVSMSPKFNEQKVINLWYKPTRWERAVRARGQRLSIHLTDDSIFIVNYVDFNSSGWPYIFFLLFRFSLDFLSRA